MQILKNIKQFFNEHIDLVQFYKTQFLFMTSLDFHLQFFSEREFLHIKSGICKAGNKVIPFFSHCHFTSSSDNLEVAAPLFRIRDDSHQQ